MTLYSDQHGTIVKTKQQEPGLEQADQAWPRDLRTRSSASSSTGEWPGTTPRGLRTRCSTTTPSHALSGALGILTSPELPRHSTCPRASEPVSQSPGERPQKTIAGKPLGHSEEDKVREPSVGKAPRATTEFAFGMGSSNRRVGLALGKDCYLFAKNNFAPPYSRKV